jgi:hypothetical protein
VNQSFHYGILCDFYLVQLYQPHHLLYH